MHCDLLLTRGQSTLSVIGSTDQAGTGAGLPSTSYENATITIAGSYTANKHESVTLSCATTGVSDAIITNGHVVIRATKTQSTGGELSSLPTSTARTVTIPNTHLSDTQPLTITIGTYDNSASSFPTSAIFSGTLSPRSGSGEEHVTCTLNIGSPPRVIGTATQAGTGAILPSTGYQGGSIAIAGSYTAAPEEALVLSCSTSGASDALLTDGQVQLLSVDTASAKSAGTGTVPAGGGGHLQAA